jgi:hypothetical protein
MKVLNILFLFTAVLFVSYADTYEERWKIYDVAEKGDALYYYDRESLNYRSKYFFSVWEKVVYITPERKKSMRGDRMPSYSLYFVEINCVHKKIKLNVIVHFGIDDDLISFYDFDFPRWSRIVRDSEVENLYLTLCPIT